MEDLLGLAGRGLNWGAVWCRCSFCSFFFWQGGLCGGCWGVFCVWLGGVRFEEGGVVKYSTAKFCDVGMVGIGSWWWEVAMVLPSPVPSR